MYGPNLTEFGVISVRRLAWAIGTNMAEAIDFMAHYLPQKRSIKTALFPIPPFPAVSLLCFRKFQNGFYWS
jgi:hypothetical protein